MAGAIRSGNWVNRNRVRAVSAITLALTIAAVIAWLVTANGTLDAMNRPLGTDFSMLWNAGALANTGQAPAAWDWPSMTAMRLETHGNVDFGFLAWLYPPPFLLVAAALAALPYIWALTVYQGITLALALRLAWLIRPARLTLLAAAGYPAVFICIGHGHNGFLTAALLGGGLFLLDRRPWLAGLLLGCLVYKPQFALLLPLVLLAAWNWRAIGGAVIAVLALVGITLMLWGWPVWQAFIDSLPQTRAIIVEQGATGWEKIQSGFAAARMWGASVPLAYGVQTMLTATALGCAVIATRTMAPNIRNAAVIAASLLSTPYVLDYDYVVLGVAILFLVVDAERRGWLDWEKSLYALGWITPLIGRTVAGAALVPLTLIVGIAVLALALRRGFVLDQAAGALRVSFRRAAPGTPATGH